MKAIELLLDLITALTLKRWFSLVIIISTVWTSIWMLDTYTKYTVYYRLDRTIGLLERLDTLERKGESSADMTLAREKALREVSTLLQANLPQNPAPNEESPTWSLLLWGKFISGGMPWFLISLITIPGVLRREGNSLPTFFSLQLFTIVFGFVNNTILSTGSFWIDHFVVPWGIFFVLIVIPASIGTVSAFRKVKDSSQKMIIINNLRQLSAAAEQFYLETGLNQVTFEQLVGPEPEKYIKHIQSVEGERYDLIEFKQGQPLLVLRRSGDIVEYKN